MPVQIASFLLPRNGNTWFILEDKYLKGGLQVCADAAARNAIDVINLKAGQLAVTQDDNRLWQLQSDLLSWTEFISASTYNPFYTHIQPSPSARWEIKHNRSSPYFSFNVYETPGGAVIPNEVLIVDDNTVVIEFIVPIAGHCSMAFDQMYIQATLPVVP